MQDVESFTRRLQEKLRAVGYGSTLYAQTLRGPTPEGLVRAPEDIWPGDPEIGNAIFQGRYLFAGHELSLPNETPWRASAPSPAWSAEAHGFAWLRHLSVCGRGSAPRLGRELVRGWLVAHGDWQAASWRADILARRLTSWLCHAGFLLDGADESFRLAFLASLDRQSRHLARVAQQADAGAPRLVAAIGLTLSGLCLPDGEKRRRRGLKLLEQELPLQILADGGHVSRNPGRVLHLLGDLVVLNETLREDAPEFTATLDAVLARMAAFLRLLRHGDGGLALFHGGRTESSDLIDITLARCRAGGSRGALAEQSGFAQLRAGRSRVIVDCGAPPAAAEAHAAPLAFEFSVAKRRLIVNCGAALDPRSEWARALRHTAAHSTLVIAERNAVDLHGERERDRRIAVSARHEEAEGNHWLDADHDGYADLFGLRHQRRLYLAAAGDDVRGEDAIHPVRKGATADLPFALRFHLDPEVRATLVQGGAVVLLRPASGAGWRFRAAGGALSLEESIYLGGARPRRSEQVVVRGRTESGQAVVKWRLNRVEDG